MTEQPVSRGRPLRLSATDRSRLASEFAGRYEQGHSLRRIATDTGHSFGLVRALLLEAGVALRRPTGGA